jgi:hypothetical protein
LGPQAIENTRKKRERHNKSLISFEKCNKESLVVAEIALRLSETSLAVPNKVLRKKAGEEKLFGIFHLLNFYLLAKKR